MNFLKSNVRTKALPAIALLLVAASSAAMSTTDGGSLKFAAAGPAGLTIDGDGGPISLEDSSSAIVLKTSMLGLKTGIDMRDEHLKKYIGAAAHPTATLSIDKAKLPHPDDGKSAEGSLQANLTFHGTTKPVMVTYKVEKKGDALKVQGRFEFDLPDYGVEVPCYLGVCVDKHIKVKAKLNVSER